MKKPQSFILILLLILQLVFAFHPIQKIHLRIPTKLSVQNEWVSKQISQKIRLHFDQFKSLSYNMKFDSVRGLIKDISKTLDLENLSNFFFQMGKQKLYFQENQFLFFADLLQKSDEILTPPQISRIIFGLNRHYSREIKTQQFLQVLNPLIAKCRGKISNVQMSMSMFGLQNMKSNILEVRKLLSLLASLYEPSDECTPMTVSNCFYGMNQMSTRYKEVRNMIPILNHLISYCKQPLKPSDIGRVLFGMRCFKLNQEPFAPLMRRIIEVIDNCPHHFTPNDITNSLIGMQNYESSHNHRLVFSSLCRAMARSPYSNFTSLQISHCVKSFSQMNSHTPEVLQALREITRHIAHSGTSLTVMDLCRALSGLRHMSSDSKEVRALLVALIEKPLFVKQPSIHNPNLYEMLLGLRNLNTRHSEVQRLQATIRPLFEQVHSFLSLTVLGNALWGLHQMQLDVSWGPLFERMCEDSEKLMTMMTLYYILQFHQNLILFLSDSESNLYLSLQKFQLIDKLKDLKLKTEGLIQSKFLFAPPHHQRELLQSLGVRAFPKDGLRTIETFSMLAREAFQGQGLMDRPTPDPSLIAWEYLSPTDQSIVTAQFNTTSSSSSSSSFSSDSLPSSPLPPVTLNENERVTVEWAKFLSSFPAQIVLKKWVRRKSLPPSSSPSASAPTSASLLDTSLSPDSPPPSRSDSSLPLIHHHHHLQDLIPPSSYRCLNLTYLLQTTNEIQAWQREHPQELHELIPPEHGASIEGSNADPLGGEENDFGRREGEWVGERREGPEFRDFEERLHSHPSLSSPTFGPDYLSSSSSSTSSYLLKLITNLRSLEASYSLSLHHYHLNPQSLPMGDRLKLNNLYFNRNLMRNFNYILPPSLTTDTHSSSPSTSSPSNPLPYLSSIRPSPSNHLHISPSTSSSFPFSHVPSDFFPFPSDIHLLNPCSIDTGFNPPSLFESSSPSSEGHEGHEWVCQDVVNVEFENRFKDLLQLETNNLRDAALGRMGVRVIRLRFDRSEMSDQPWAKLLDPNTQHTSDQEGKNHTHTTEGSDFNAKENMNLEEDDIELKISSDSDMKIDWDSEKQLIKQWFLSLFNR